MCSFDVPFVRILNSYTFLELSLAGIYGLCMNSMVYYIGNNNPYNQYIPQLHIDLMVSMTSIIDLKNIE